MEYKVIDNFLSKNDFKIIQDIMINDVKGGLVWLYRQNVVRDNEKMENWKLFYMIHRIYEDHIIQSDFYEPLIPILEILEVKALLRIKANMYPNTESLKEHGMHTDYRFSHKGAIFSVNTCDGYTKLEDGTKIDSIENRMLLFDPSTPHSSSTTTDQVVRVNINFNYF